MADSAEFYLDTDSEAATFASGLYVEDLALKDSFNHVGSVLGHTATANNLWVNIGWPMTRSRYCPPSSIRIKFNLYDSEIPKSACIEDMVGIFDRLVARDDIRRGFCAFGMAYLAEWAGNEAWLHPNPPAGEEADMVVGMLDRLIAANYIVGDLPAEGSHE